MFMTNVVEVGEVSKCNCPVCNTKYDVNVTICQVCGFSDRPVIDRVFNSSAEAEFWIDTVVAPFRMKWQFERLGVAYNKQTLELEAIRAEHKEIIAWKKDAEERLQRLEKVLQEAKGLISLPLQAAVSLTKSDNIVRFGDIDWRVLVSEQDGRALLISGEILNKRAYYDIFADGSYPHGKNWEQSSIRKYLNGEFLEQFSQAEKDRIVLTKNITDDTDETDDHVFLLSIDEARKMFKGNADRIAKYKEKDSWWWLRCKGRDIRRVASVFSDGHVYIQVTGADSNGGGVRPALWINLQ